MGTRQIVSIGIDRIQVILKMFEKSRGFVFVNGKPSNYIVLNLSEEKARNVKRL
jgi:hypothetical protein